jgi:hypothetical protein
MELFSCFIKIYESTLINNVSRKTLTKAVRILSLLLFDINNLFLTKLCPNNYSVVLISPVNMSILCIPKL